MDTLTAGIVIYVVAMLAIGVAIAFTLSRVRGAGLSGSALIRKLVPHLVADILITIVFAFWFLSQQQG